MDNVSIDKTHEVGDRISAIVNHLIQTKSIFQDFDPIKTSQAQTEGMLKFWSPEQVVNNPPLTLSGLTGGSVKAYS